MTKKKELNTNRKILNGIYWSAAEKIFTNFIESLISIILARLLLPSDYGLISLVQIFISISSIFVGCGLGDALIQKKNASNQEISTIFYLNIFLGFFIYIILFMLAPLIAQKKNNVELVSLIRIMSIKIPISSVYSMQHSYIKKMLDFRKFFFSSLLGTIVSGFIGIIMAYKGFGVWSLVFSSLIDQLIDCIVLAFTTKWFPKFDLALKKSMDIIRFGYKMFLSNFISRTYEQTRSLIIGIKYSTSDLAFSMKGNKIASMPVAIVDTSISKVMFPALSQIQDDHLDLVEKASNAIRISFYLVSPFLVGLIAIADTLIPFLLTSKWNGCVPYVQLYCLIYMFNCIFSIDVQIIQAKGRSDLCLIYNVVEIVFELIGILVSIFVVDNPVYVVISILFACTITRLLVISFCKKIVNFGLFDHLKIIVKTLIIDTAMFVIVYAINFINIKLLPKLIIQILIGVLTYIIFSFFLKEKTFYIIIGNIKKMIKRKN